MIADFEKFLAAGSVHSHGVVRAAGRNLRCRPARARAEDGVVGEHDGTAQLGGRDIPDLNLAEAGGSASAGNQQFEPSVEKASDRIRSECPGKSLGDAIERCSRTSRFPDTASVLPSGEKARAVITGGWV